MITTAKDPKLRMKLMNMPILLDPEKGGVDTYVRGVLEAAFSGNLNRVPVLDQ